MFPDKDTDADETKETETRDNRGCFFNCKDWCCCTGLQNFQEFEMQFLEARNFFVGAFKMK